MVNCTPFHEQQKSRPKHFVWAAYFNPPDNLHIFQVHFESV